MDGKTYHDDTASIVPLKIDPLCDFSSRNRKENPASAHITSLPILDKTLLSLSRIFLLNINVLILNKFIYDSSFLPMLEYMFHVDIRREEAKDSIGDDIAQSSQ